MNKWQHLVGFALFLGYLLALIHTNYPLAMSRDESFYVDAANQYGAWFEVAWNDPALALRKETIDRLWEYNHEHPALMKSLFAISHLANKKFELFEQPSLGYRLPAMIISALLVWLIFAFAARLWSFRAGVFSALAFACMPRVFYHAHLNCFDIPIVFFVTLTTYAYWRSLESRRWLWVLGLVYGLALATKHNAWIIPGVFLIHWLSLRIVHRPPLRWRHYIPWWLLFMAVLGPPIFVASWPWLYYDTLERFNWYASFHLNHEHYAYAYWGYTYFQPPFPLALPFVLTALTVPVGILACMLSGMGLRIRYVLGPLIGALRPAFAQFCNIVDARWSDLLIFGSALAPLVVIALPSTPIFGGTKHWMTAYPFLCLYAGYAFDRALAVVSGPGGRSKEAATTFGFAANPNAADAISDLANGNLATTDTDTVVSPPDIFEPPGSAGDGPDAGGLQSATVTPRDRLGQVASPMRAGAAVLAGVALLAPGAFGAWHARGYGLSYYNVLAGGARGAAKLGMNRQFWGFTQGNLGPYLRKRLPDGGTVWLCDATWRSWEMMIADGIIPPNIRAASSIAQADLALVHHERHFLEVEAQIWTVYRNIHPDYVLTFDGVPIISVYANPQSARIARK